MTRSVECDPNGVTNTHPMQSKNAEQSRRTSFLSRESSAFLKIRGKCRIECEDTDKLDVGDMSWRRTEEEVEDGGDDADDNPGTGWGRIRPTSFCHLQG